MKIARIKIAGIKIAGWAVILQILTTFLLLMPIGSGWAQERVDIGSPEELLGFFEDLNYTPEAWQSGIRDIPRAYIMKVSKNWKISSQNIAVVNKKRIFFRSLAPLVLRANEIVLKDRDRLLALTDAASLTPGDESWLMEKAAEYKVEADNDQAAIATLTARIDAVPVSLVLAQGAEESGWGTSRFAAEGNALFGQWTWGGKGITPKGQRKGLGNYKIAAFDTPLASVKAYIQNLNTHRAYSDLRARRKEMRDAGERLSGWDLAETLSSYSERGPKYVESLHAIMRVNRLRAADEAVLAKGEYWLIYPKN